MIVDAWLFFFSSLILCVSAEIPDSSLVDNLARSIEQFALDLENSAGIKDLEEAYDGLSSSVTFHHVNGQKLARTVSTELTEKVFLSKIEAIQYAVKETEKLAANYKWQPNLKTADLPVFNKSHFDADVRYRARFGRNVNFNYSSVHTPVDIYSGASDIVNGLAWTANLTQVFKTNLLRHPDLLWQYFGSNQGFLHYYPGAEWTTRGVVDLYDARRRPWYIQGSSSPKDMLILIDSSGSTLGQTLYLMKLTARLLLDTLGEDDFVLVANFSDKANLVTDCFDSFVQANTLNKQILNDAIDLIDPGKQANFTAALEFAFNYFEKLEAAKSRPGSNKTHAGAGCNKLIVILTDGGTEKPEQLIRRHDPDGSKYRIFSYAVGQSPSPLDAVQWLGCANHGWFSRIENIGAIKPSIQNIMRSLHDPKSSAMAGTSTLYWDYLQPGSEMLTTLTMPVYNKTQDGDAAFLGVIGIDVAMQQIVDKLPTVQMGPRGYAFAINHNGYVLFHPWLKPQETWLPDTPSIDIIDLELIGKKSANGKDDKDEMRQTMIDGDDEGSYTYSDTLILYGKLKYVTRESRSYYISNIANTSFSLGISLPQKTAQYVNLSSFEHESLAYGLLRNWTVAGNESELMLYLARWRYCDNISKDEEESETDALDDKVRLAELVELFEAGAQCNHALRLHLLWDMMAMRNLVAVWEKQFAQQRDQGNGSSAEAVHFVFSSSSGITAVRRSAAHDYYNLPAQEEGKGFDPFTSSSYHRAYHRPTELVFAAPKDEGVASEPGNSTGPLITAVKAVTLNKSYTPAVAGLKYSYRRLQSLLTAAAGGEACSNRSVSCYLLDEGAYIIVSSADDLGESVGTFLGDVDHSLLHLLVNGSVYELHERLDYQGIARQPSKSSSAPSGYAVRSIYLFLQALLAQWWNLASLYMYQLYSLLYNLAFNAHIGLSSAEGSSSHDGKSMTVLKKYPLCMFAEAAASYAVLPLNATFDGCSRQATVKRIKSTNLLLVVADSMDGYMEETCNGLPKRASSGEVQPLREHMCRRDVRYRNSGAELCHRHDKTTTRYTCNAAEVTGATRVTWLLPMLLLWCTSDATAAKLT